MKTAKRALSRSRKKQAELFRDLLRKFFRQSDGEAFGQLRRLLAGNSKISRSERDRWSLHLEEFGKRYRNIEDFAFGTSTAMKPVVLAMDYLVRYELLGKASAAKTATANEWRVKQSAVADAITDRREVAAGHIRTILAFRTFKHLNESRPDALRAILAEFKKRYPHEL